MKKSPLLLGCAAVFIVVLVVVLQGQAPSPDSAARARPQAEASVRADSAGAPGDAVESGLHPPHPANAPGYGPVRALAKAYPDRIARAEIRGGQWALEMDATWYYWADGRLLPKTHLDDADSFVSLRFYENYELGPPEQREISPELAERLRDRDSVGGNDERSRFNEFNDTLFGVSSHAEGDATMVWMRFLGIRTRVHPMLEEPLRRVDDRIRKAASVDPQTQRFVDELFQIHGYNWRNIAGTARRSYHAYGVAVDLLPIRWNGGWAYWQWAYDGGVGEWWDLPFEDRWMVPQPVIDAFEAEGFVWGGKWLFFDNMHFEYRPESIILAQRDRRAGK